MKIRNGFVSNSSSSSFIVAFPKKPNSAWECREIMFGPTEGSDYGVNGTQLDKYEAAVAVFKELRGRKAWSRENVAKHIGSSPIIELEQNFPMPQQQISQNEEEYDCLLEEYFNEWELENKKAINRFFDDNSGCFIFTFTYGDDDGRFWALMEHSGIFNKLPHLTVSHH